MSTAGLSPLKRALLAIEGLQARLDAAERARSEAVAVIGMACRLPRGIDTPAAFWELLAAGGDAVTEVPAERWDIDAYYDPNPDAPGRMNTRWGGFLSGVDQFDPQFFGISPREAVSLDPQQRLMLEVAWEALEDAGKAPDGLRGSATGVYIGVLGSDYGDMQLADGGIERIDSYFGSGNARSMVSGRLSYLLGLHGPSVSIDTACSSSLVALHLACQSLRSGESKLAIVGGVNLTLQPEPTIALSRFRMMAGDGRCKTFDRRADGYVRSEACCAVILKPLSAALAAGDRILALIRGSAVNQDGASSGLTAPNGPAQEAVIRAALGNSGVSAADVSYVEAHGTGTSLGDPIEVQAIARALTEHRAPAEPVYVGAVKANVGHTEAAAGLVGLLKTVLCLQRRQFPAQLHLREPNPMIPWADLAVRVPETLVDWPPGRPLIAGVSSFGFSGTNVHVLLEAAPPVALPAMPRSERPRLLTLSAASQTALRATASRYAAWLHSNPAADFQDVCFTANVARVHKRHRLSLLAEHGTDAAERLAIYAAEGNAAGVQSSHLTSDEPPPVAFLFTGQGAQYHTMGLGLYGREPAFTATLDCCEQLFLQHAGLSVLQVIGDEQALADTAFAQPAIFALEVALSAMWRSWGIEPGAVLGHSLGEYVAAYVAGMLSLEDAVRLVAARARLMGALPRGGRMVALAADREQVESVVARHWAEVSVAAFNGPSQVVISGTTAGVARVLAELGSSAEEARELPVSHAFHSPLMDPILDEFERLAAEVRHERPRLRLISNLTGTVARQGEAGSGSYWRAHLRNPVRFADGLDELRRLKFRLFLELGPAPILCALGARSGSDARFIATLRQGQPDWPQLLRAASSLYAAGARLDWRSAGLSGTGRILSLPTSVFERRRYWLSRPSTRRSEAFQSQRDWFYEINWQCHSLRARAVDLPARWLICADTVAAADTLAKSCALRGIRTLTAARTPASSLIEWLRSPELVAFKPTAILFLAGEWAQQGPAEMIREECLAAARWLLAIHGSIDAPPLWLVTRGAHACNADAAPVMTHAALAAWGRVAALEYPQALTGVIDLDPADRSQDCTALAATLAADTAEEQVAWRAGQSLVPRVCRLSAETDQAMRWHSDRCYLVTGWMGGLGLQLVRWLVDRGVRHLVLLGRRELDATDQSMRAAADLAGELELRGLKILHAQLDTADDVPALRELFQRFGADLPQLAGVFHLAASLSDGAIERLDARAYECMLRPKVTVACLLHELTRALPLDCFVLFSSMTAVLGTQQLAHYAASNAALDALAQQRRQQALPALSVNWGSWQDMRGATEQNRLLFQRSGVRPMKIGAALATLEQALMLPLPQLLIADIDWPTLTSVYQARRLRPLLSDMSAAASAAAPSPSVDGGRWNFADVAAERRPDALTERIRSEVARIIGLDNPPELDITRGLFELGLDSLMAVELRRSLAAKSGHELPLTLSFNYPTVAALSGYMVELLFGNQSTPTATATDAHTGAELVRRLQAKLREVQV